MNIENLIEDYIKYSLALHNENDFYLKRKFIEKNNKILDKVYKYHLEFEFFNRLFECNYPFVLADVASDSLARKYDIIKSLEIMKYLKRNSYNLIFSENDSINKEAQKYYKNIDLYIYENEAKFYTSIDDKSLYVKYYEFFELIDNEYSYLTKNTNDKKSYKSWNNEILELLEKLKVEGKAEKFFKITKKKFESFDYYYPMVVNAFYVYKILNDREYAKKIFNLVLTKYKSKITPNLKELTQKYLNVIE